MARREFNVGDRVVSRYRAPEGRAKTVATIIEIRGDWVWVEWDAKPSPPAGISSLRHVLEIEVAP